MHPTLTPGSTTPAATGPRVVLFDFDGTLTRGDTLLPFLRRLLGWPTLGWLLLVCSPWLIGYLLRVVSNHRAKAALLQACLGKRRWSDVDRCAENFVHHALPDQWRAPVLKQLVDHQHAGDVCVLVSASTSAYMHRVGACLGVDAVICTELEVFEGRYTGYLATPNCHGVEKVRRVREWLVARFGDKPPSVISHAYGDSRADLPMLAMARHRWYRGKMRALL